MKQFLLKSLAVFFLLFGVLTLIKSTVPYYWGNKYYPQKIDFYESENNDYDCLFFGSSKVIRQINPIIIDSITGYHSYNFGSPYTYYLETHYLLENFLKNDTEKTLNIFLEKLTPNTIDDKNYHTLNSKYWLDFKRTRIGVYHFWKIKNYKQVRRHVASYIENMLCIGELKAIFEFHLRQKKILPSWAIQQQRGYYSVEQQVKHKDGGNFQKRKKEFQESELYIENKVVPGSLKQLKIRKLHPKEISLDMEGKHIKLFQILPITLEPEYYFDKGHFNDKGSAIFSQKIADFILKKGLPK